MTHGICNIDLSVVHWTCLKSRVCLVRGRSRSSTASRLPPFVGGSFAHSQHITKSRLGILRPCRSEAVGYMEYPAWIKACTSYLDTHYGSTLLTYCYVSNLYACWRRLALLLMNQSIDLSNRKPSPVSSSNPNITLYKRVQRCRRHCSSNGLNEQQTALYIPHTRLKTIHPTSY